MYRLRLIRFAKMIKESEWTYIFFVILISLYPRFRYFFHSLYKLSPASALPRAYDTDWYIQHANQLLHNFKIELTVDGVFYFSYYSLLSLFLLIFKSETIIIFVQMIINALTVILVYKISRILFSRRAGVIAGILYAYTWPLISWSMFITTDSLFVSLLLLNVFFLLKSYIDDSKAYKYLFIASSIYLLFFRPTGIISLSFIFVYILLNMKKGKLKEYINGRAFGLAAVIGLVTVISALFIGYSKLKPLSESFYNYLYWLLDEIYANGQIFDVKTKFDYKYNAIKTVTFFNSFPLSFFINNWYHILILYARRALFFWAFSLGHFTIVKLYFIIVYAFGLFSMVSIIKNRIFKKTSILFLIILSIMFFCVFFFMDSAYRYRVPALVFANIVAAYGIDNTIEIIGRNFRKKVWC